LARRQSHRNVASARILGPAWQHIESSHSKEASDERRSYIVLQTTAGKMRRPEKVGLQFLAQSSARRSPEKNDSSLYLMRQRGPEGFRLCDEIFHESPPNFAWPIALPRLLSKVFQKPALPLHLQKTGFKMTP
jgi:hypothetical protein